jgi:4-hydroxybenzoate polyprenyltransferase
MGDGDTDDGDRALAREWSANVAVPRRCATGTAALLSRSRSRNSPHQWARNLSVFVPAFAADRFEWGLQQYLIIAFRSLSACDSGGYVLNDLIDVEADRRHPR